MVREKPELALLAVQRWPIVDHLWVDFHLGEKRNNLLTEEKIQSYLVNPLHVIPQLFQVFDVAIADFANDKVALAPTLTSSWLPRFDGWCR